MTADALVDLGLQHQQSGRTAEAKNAYERAIALDPLNADAHNLLGTVLQASGDFAQAAEAHRRAVALVEDESSFHNNLATALLSLGDLESSATHYHRAAELEPGLLNAWTQIGVIRRQQGRPAEAVDAFRQVAMVRPDDANVLNNLGSALRYAGQSAAAIGPLRRACELDPRSAMARDNLTRAYHEAQLFNESAEEATTLIALDPHNPVAASLQLIALNSARRSADAVEAARQSIKKFPDELELHFQLATAFQALGEFAPAIIALRRCLEIAPENLRVVARLGWVLFLLGQPYEARDVLLEALQLDDDDAEVWLNLSIAYLAVSDLTKATEAARKAVALRPTFPGPTLQLVSTLLRQGLHDEVEATLDAADATIGEHPLLLIQRGAIAGERGFAREAIALFNRATVLDPTLRHTGSLAAMFYNYVDDVSADDVFAAHTDWGRQYDDIIADNPRSADRFNITVEPDRRLRVGLVSPDFRGHSVAFFAFPLFKHLDRQKFELVCFDNTRTLDPMSKAMHGYADAWHRVVGISDLAVADLIRKEKIDVLIDLAGHTSDSRLVSFAFRPAPVQVSYLGYPNTSGLSAMDYRFVDSVTDPPGMADRRCVEKLIRIDPIFLSYMPQDAPVSAVEPPSRVNGFITFGSFNNFAKASDTTIRMWSGVLRAIPDARLLIKSNGLGNPATRLRAEQRFNGEGIDPGRLEFVSRLPEMQSHLSMYNRVDVALDTYPYSGTTTTCESLWMGVPTITRVGDRHPSRVSGSILHCIGAADWVAEDEAAFVAKAVALAMDPTRLSDARRSLRETMQRSPLMDHAGFVRRFELAIRKIWKEWCAGVSPA